MKAELAQGAPGEDRVAGLGSAQDFCGQQLPVLQGGRGKGLLESWKCLRLPGEPRTSFALCKEAS